MLALTMFRLFRSVDLQQFLQAPLQTADFSPQTLKLFLLEPIEQESKQMERGVLIQAEQDSLTRNPIPQLTKIILETGSIFPAEVESFFRVFKGILEQRIKIERFRMRLKLFLQVFFKDGYGVFENPGCFRIGGKFCDCSRKEFRNRAE